VIYVDEERCESFGLDSKRVASIARRLSRAATEARELGLTVFGGSGTGTLRFHRDGSSADIRAVVADLDGDFDGGDGGDVFD